MNFHERGLSDWFLELGKFIDNEYIEYPPSSIKNDLKQGWGFSHHATNAELSIFSNTV